ncbi:MAG: TonB-dependent receptor [Pseudomonadota bacterium]
MGLACAISAKSGAWADCSGVDDSDTDQTTYRLDIPASSLGDATDALVRQTGLQILFPHGLRTATVTRDVTGEFTVNEALCELLRDTGLAGGFTQSGVITIARAGNEPKNREGKVATVKTKASLLASVSAFLFGFGGANGAFAQTGADDGATDEIIVVGRSFRDPSDSAATKLNIPLSETAGQVLVLTEDFTDALGNIGVLDTLEFLPGISNTSTGGNGFFLIARGFGLNSANGFRLNGAPLGSDVIFDQSALSRFEYVKGAQAASYGQISAAGFINLALKEAGDEAAGNLQVRVDNNSGVRGEITYGGPLNDAGTVRLLGSLARETNDTQYENNVDGFESNSAYANLAIDFTDNLTSKFYLYYDKRNGPLIDGPSAGVDLTDPANAQFIVDYISPEAYFNPYNGDNTESLFFQAYTAYQFDNGHTLSGSFSVTDSFRENNWSLPSGFAPRFSSLVNLTPGTAGFGLISPQDVFFRDQTDVLTRYAEIRYSGDVQITDDAVFNFIVSGEHYFNEAIGVDVGSNFDAVPATISAINPVYTGGDPFNVPTDTLRDVFQDSDQKINSISFLFSLDLYDRLRINGGIRHDDYRGRDGIDDLANADTFTRGTQSYSASIAYDISEQFTAYYAYSDGFEFVNELDCNGNVTPPEENVTHEAGLKWEPNSGLLGSIAVFDNSATNSLTFDECPIGSSNINGAVVLTDGEQTARGVELELVGQLTEGWSFGGGVSYIDDVFGQFDFAETPKFSLNFFTTYDFPEESALDKFSIGGGMRAIFGRRLASANDFFGQEDGDIPASVETINGIPLADLFDTDGNFLADQITTSEDDYVLVDALVAYELTDKISLQVNARNLFDSYYLQRTFALDSGIIVGEPRTVLGTVNFDF